VDDDDRVFKALADRTRRLLLDRLFDRDGRTLTELESELDMTRFGVAKHLRVLEDVSLVVTRRSGREKLHFLNPVPIRLIHDRWVDKYTVGPASALAHLKRHLEEQPMTTAATTEATATQIYRVFIKATPEMIWAAITDPDQTVNYFHGARIQTTAERQVSHGPDGSVWGDGKVFEFDPPRRLVHEWRSMYDPELGQEPASRVTWDIEAKPGGYCQLTLTHDQLDNSPKTAASVYGPGWMFVLSALKTLLETGSPLSSN